LFATYIIFAILLNSVGTVIFQSIQYFGVSKLDASVLEGFKDLPIAIVSFLIASSLPRLGYRKGMMIALGAVALACLAMPVLDAYWATKLLFFTTGSAFAVTKISIYSSVGLLTKDSQHHASLLNILEGFFMVGVLSGYWIFSFFIDAADPTSPAWLNVYWFLAALCIANIFLLMTASLDESAARKPSADSSLLHEFRGMLALAALPLVIAFLAAAFLYVLIEQGIGTWLPTFNSEVFHLPARMSVQAASIYAGALAIGRFGAGGALKFIDWRMLLVICLVSTAVLIALSLPLAKNAVAGALYTWTSAPLGAYVFPLIGFFMAPVYPVLNSIMLSTLPKHKHAAMTGLIVIFSALGGTTGSLITGRVFAVFSGPTAFYLVIPPILGILGLVFLISGLRASYRRDSLGQANADGATR